MVIIYVDMVADLFHLGHVEILRKSKDLGDILIVGVHNDSDVETYKRTPILTMEERIKIVESCKYVDRVIPNAPLQITEDYLREYNIDFVVHGDDISEETKNI